MEQPDYNDVKEITGKVFKDKLEEIASTRDFKKYGRDGYVEEWRQTYNHRGIDYDIALLRYYQLNRNIYEIKGINKHKKHFVLEYPESSKKIVELFYKTWPEDSDFLYKDTLHSWNEKQTLNEMFDEIVKAAKQDIDNFLDNSDNELNAKIKELNELKVELKR
jgi:hypothetical protein